MNNNNKDRNFDFIINELRERKYIEDTLEKFKDEVDKQKNKKLDEIKNKDSNIENITNQLENTLKSNDTNLLKEFFKNNIK